MTRDRGAGPGAPAAARLLALAVLLAIATHLPSLRNGFTFDDHAVIALNPHVTQGEIQEIWTSPYWPERPQAGLYRPLTTLSFALDWRLGGGRPWVFHLTNVLLHAAVVLSVFALARTLRPDRVIAASLASLLFAVHPIHTEAVFSTVGRAELLAALSSGAACLCALAYARGGAPTLLVASLPLFGAALLSKESSVGIWLVILGCAALARAGRLDRTSPRRWLSCAGLWLGVGLAVLAARRVALGSWFGLETVSLMDNPLAHAPALERIASALGLLWIYVWRFVLPVTLSADYSFPQLVPSPGWMLAGAAWVACVLSATVFAWRQGRTSVLVALLWWIMTGLPTSNVALPIGTVLGERLAYTPSMAACWILAGGVVWACGRARAKATRRVIVASVGIVCALWAVRTAGRAGDWRDDRTLFTATVQASPRSAKAHTNLAVTHLRGGDPRAALGSGERARALAPNYAPADAVVGSALFQLGDPEAALTPLRRATRAAGPRTAAEPWLELGNAYLALQRPTEADSIFRYLQSVLGPTDRRVWIGLASADALRSRWRESAAAWQNVVALDPGDASAQRAWAFAAWQAGAGGKADSIYSALLGRTPGDALAQNDFAWFLAESGRDPARAVELATHAYSGHPSREVADTVVRALLRARGPSEASDWIDAQIDLSEADRAALHAAVGSWGERNR